MSPDPHTPDGRHPQGDGCADEARAGVTSCSHEAEGSSFTYRAHDNSVAFRCGACGFTYDTADRAQRPPAGAEADDERIYPCVGCDRLRSEREGGTTFTVCDACWDARPTPAGLAAPERAALEAERDGFRRRAEEWAALCAMGEAEVARVTAERDAAVNARIDADWRREVVERQWKPLLRERDGWRDAYDREFMRAEALRAECDRLRALHDAQAVAVAGLVAEREAAQRERDAFRDILARLGHRTEQDAGGRWTIHEHPDAVRLNWLESLAGWEWFEGRVESGEDLVDFWPTDDDWRAAIDAARTPDAPAGGVTG